MAATLTGAVKALLTAAGITVPVYRGRAYEGAPLPYIVVTEGVSTIFDSPADGGDTAAAQTGSETIAVDLWQASGVAEDFTLPGAVTRALHTANLPAAPLKVYAVTVNQVTRVEDPNQSLLHDSLTVVVRRRI